MSGLLQFASGQGQPTATGWQEGYCQGSMMARAENDWHSIDLEEQAVNFHDVFDDRTTLMVRNIPSDLSQPAFVQKFIVAGYGGLFDFVYMPMNFRGQGNFGYAFID